MMGVMQVNGSEWLGAMKAARLFAMEDETRSSLNCIQLLAVKDALRITATDGQTLWCCEVPARGDNTGPAWSIPLATVDALLRSIAKTWTEVEIDLVKRTIQGEVYPEAHGVFPPVRQVIPAIDSLESNDPKRVLPTFAAEYIARCCEGLRLYARGFNPNVPKLSKRDREQARKIGEKFLSPPIAMRMGDEDGPSLFFSPAFPAAFAVVMPRREGGTVPIASFIARIRSGTDDAFAPGSPIVTPPSEEPAKRATKKRVSRQPGLANDAPAPTTPQDPATE